MFFGAHWCNSCEKQKARFGEVAFMLPYVECYRRNPDRILDICENQGIEAYPTWVFSDGTVKTGSLSLQTLARLTDCEPPG